MRPHELANLRIQMAEADAILYPYTKAGRRRINTWLMVWFYLIAMAVIGPVAFSVGFHWAATYQIEVDYD